MSSTSPCPCTVRPAHSSTSASTLTQRLLPPPPTAQPCPIDLHHGSQARSEHRCLSPETGADLPPQCHLQQLQQLPQLPRLAAALPQRLRSTTPSPSAAAPASAPWQPARLHREGRGPVRHRRRGRRPHRPDHGVLPREAPAAHHQDHPLRGQRPPRRLGADGPPAGGRGRHQGNRGL